MEVYRAGIYWSVMSLSVLIVGFTIYHIQVIPGTIAGEVNHVLEKRPWIRDFIVIDGRQVYLRGEIEPDSGLETEIAAIAKIPGVQRVINVLDEVPRPSAHFKLQVENDRVLVSGQLNGDFLEPVISSLEATFPDQQLQDRIKIDDRLGRPLWVNGFDQSLDQMASLENFEFNGWRDQVEITGVADSDLLRRQVGYGIPASLNQQVKVINRLRIHIPPELPSITLVSDWRGTFVTGIVPSMDTRERLLDIVSQAFGDESVAAEIEVDEGLGDSSDLNSLLGLLPSLGQVRDLRLESTAHGFIVWGRVDEPLTLGRFLQARNALGLEQVIQSEITVAEADNSASLTLFTDQKRAILNGTLPTIKSRQELIGDIKKHLGVYSIVDFVSIEPNTAHSAWLTKWPALLESLPRSVIGITIDEDALLVTGVADSKKEFSRIDQQLGTLFPDTERLNWITTSKQ
jgi:hypothetical protein